MLPETPVQADTCSECGQPIPPDARTFGLCPRCLIRSAIGVPDGSDADRGGAGSPSSDGRPPAAPPSPAELAGHFVDLEILELIGRGGMGIVYKARQLSLDRLVALKLFPVDATGDPAFAERFRLEARVLASLGYPNVVTAHQFGQTARYCYLVMEYVEGPSLRDLLGAGPLAPDAALRIAMQVCDALQYAHGRGVIHRDIKPENILLDRPPADGGGDVGRVRVADFGLAKLTAADRSRWAGLTVTGQRLGTPLYAAPEQTRPPRAGQADDSPADERSDLYSVGVVLYEMLTGSLPLGRFPTPSQKARVDARLDVIVLRCLDADPSLRYQTTGELRAALAAVLAAPVLPMGGMPAPYALPVQPGMSPPLPPPPPMPLPAMTAPPAGFGPSAPSYARMNSPLGYEPVAPDSSRWSPLLVVGIGLAAVFVLVVLSMALWFLRRQSAVRTATIAASTRRATPAPFTGAPGSMKSMRVPSPPPFPRPPGFPGGPFPSRTGPGDYLEQMISLHGADRVVTIRIDGLNGDVREFLVDRLKSASGAGNFFTTGSGDSLTVHLAPVSDVQALADKIDFGEVKQVDAARRTIDVRADPSKLPEPLKPEVNDPQDPAFYARNLEDLSSWDTARRHAAVVHLRDAAPARDRSKIAAALVARLKDDPDRAVRTEAAAALATWGTEATAPALIAALKDADPFVKRKAMETLAKRKDPDAAGPLAACLKIERHHAAECLKRYGPGAEEAVLPYLDDDDGWVRLEAAKVLQEIGTARSLPALRQAAAGHDGLLPGAAKQAVSAIEERGELPTVR